MHGWVIVYYIWLHHNEQLETTIERVHKIQTAMLNSRLKEISSSWIGQVKQTKPSIQGKRKPFHKYDNRIQMD
jgi:hypothetical protein